MNSSLALIWTITAATTLLQAGNGLLQALMPLRMQAEGISVASIGVVAAAYGLGFSTGCFLAPSFIRHVGYIRAFASLAAVVSVLVLVMTQAHSTLAWIILRGLTGVTLACIFTVTDGWISARATLQSSRADPVDLHDLHQGRPDAVAARDRLRQYPRRMDCS